MSRMKDMVKRTVKRTVGLAGHVTAAPDSTSRILTYHSVGARDHEMNVRPEVFREQMTWLKEAAAVLPLERAASCEPGVALNL